MKKSVLFFCVLFFNVTTFLFAADSTGIHLIPQPVSVQQQNGSFILDNTVSLVIPSSDKALTGTAQWFTDHIKTATGFSLPTSNTAKASKVIQLQLNKKANATIGDEGYTLNVSPQQIVITANKSAGVFYGLQTLLQLLPPDIESNSAVKNTTWTIPAVAITDYPRFGWRGLMLDVSRHFFTKDEVKKYIDEMVKYKFNTFHWHLSDDQGWRIEIKSLPQLTKEGAWRVERVGRWGTFEAPQPGEPTPYGGYYTQDDIRDILKYAQDRFVTILPEIDVPAHSLALISAYPNLSCTQLQYPVNPGSNFYKKEDNVLCVGNDSTFLMLDKIFTEIAALFPNQYIHVGGDEAYKGFWADCPKCQKRMATEHLKNVEELQSYFVKRMEKILKSKGKKLIGWDEILEGGLAPEATVMSWRGMSGGIQAARMNHHVVMTPWDFTYLDLYQGEPSAEPPTYGMCRLTDSYHYDPVPDSVDAKLILGGQGNLWTESVPNFRQAEYMTWPRGIALSEVYWSPKSSRNWDSFIDRLEDQFQRLDAADIKYATSMYNAIATPKAGADSTLQVTLTTEVPNVDLYYTFDMTNPDNFYPKYKGEPLTFPKGATQINIVSYKNGKPVGKQVNITKEVLIKRLDQKKHVY